MISIHQASLDRLSPSEVERMYQLMVTAYAATEVEIWGENYVRMYSEEYASLIAKGTIYYAELEGVIVGSIMTDWVDSQSFGFGLLNADFAYKGRGIGRLLIEQAESVAKIAGADYMKLEILRPSEIQVPQKQQLANWYTKLGYTFIESMSFVDRKPDKAEKAKNFVAPSQFDCYEKAL